MKAVFAATINNADPLAALEVGELPEPQPRPFWSTVSVKVRPSTIMTSGASRAWGSQRRPRR